MEIFKVNKYQSKYENILYISKMVYEIVKKPMTIDLIFKSLEKKIDCVLSPDIGSMVLLSLDFLYSIGLIDVKDDNIKRREKNDL